MFPPDIKIRIHRDFGADRVESIYSKFKKFIEQFEKIYKDKPSNRIIRCIIRLSEGDEERLDRFLRQALADWRDVIYWSEYDRDGKKVWSGSRRFIKE